MGIQLRVTLAASAVSLAAGVLIGYFVSTSQGTVVETLKTANEVVRKENISDDRLTLSGKKENGHEVENFEIIKQLPELPTGCEVTSLTMVLNYMGFEVDKLEIARNYLEKDEIVPDGDDKLYGPDFRYVFAGNPEDENSFGCLAPCLVSAAQRFLSENEAAMSPLDLTGKSFDELFDFIDHDIPVIMWSTLGLAAPEFNLKWTTPDNEEVTWPTNEHCIVLTGYDKEENTVRIHDPINGVITLNMDAVRERYDQLGRNAAVIINNK